jgi:hypothetical protein
MDQLPQKNSVFGGVGTHSSRAFMVVHVGVMWWHCLELFFLQFKIQKYRYFNLFLIAR